MDTCELCGRPSHKRWIDRRRNVKHAKLRNRHRCPHGNWCVRGELPAGIHQNHPLCSQCLKEEKTRGRA